MKAVIIAGGAIKDFALLKKYIKTDDFIICADSGYDHACRMNITPDIVVGDMDSIKSKIRIDHVKVYPAKKEFTDTEIAVNVAIEHGCDEILILGAIGTRMDHSFSNILLIKRLYESGINAMIADEHNEILVTGESIGVTGEAGDLISIIPISDCEGVSTWNLEFPLNNEPLYLGSSRGVSNVMLGTTAKIEIKSGFALIMRCKD